MNNSFRLPDKSKEIVCLLTRAKPTSAFAHVSLEDIGHWVLIEKVYDDCAQQSSSPSVHGVPYETFSFKICLTHGLHGTYIAVTHKIHDY